jgi:crotonobetainyl-CoA:carnitine CoA-transferase CaiB-like acyl-CoA transferase
MALMDSQVAVLGYQALNYFASGKPPKRLGNAHPNIVPYDVFPAADGSIIIAVGNDGQFAKLCDAVDAADLRHNPDYGSNEAACATAPCWCRSSGGAPFAIGGTSCCKSSPRSRCRPGR